MAFVTGKNDPLAEAITEKLGLKGVRSIVYRAAVDEVSTITVELLLDVAEGDEGTIVATKKFRLEEIE